MAAEEKLYRVALREALAEEMERDESIFLIGEDIGTFGGAYRVTEGLLDKFGPQRVVDAPIAEEVIVGSAIGAAMLGLRPVVELMTINFSLVAYDQIVNNAAKIRYMFGGEATVPMVIRTPGGAGAQLTAQHSQSLEVWFASTPGLKVLAPATPADAKGLLKAAIRDEDPVMFLENVMLSATKEEIPDGEELIPFGVANIRRTGDDMTFVALGTGVPHAMAVADKLAKEDISVEVVDVRTLVPLDVETIANSVRKTSRAVVLHEAAKRLGYGAEIAATIQEECFWHLDQPVVRIAAKNTPTPTSPPLEDAVIPQPADIAETLRKVARA